MIIVFKIVIFYHAHRRSQVPYKYVESLFALHNKNGNVILFDLC